MLEQSKSAKRRFNVGAFHSRYFVGAGIDIGGKPDPLGQYAGLFSNMESVLTWDIEDGDAQLMEEVEDNSFDFVHSSHCLEHMRDVDESLGNWIRITKPGGYLILTVPDEDMYERGKWPSESNPDHKWTFTVYKDVTWSERSINIVDLIKRPDIEVEKIEQIKDFYRHGWDVDQTMTATAECCIEIILRKCA